VVAVESAIGTRFFRPLAGPKRSKERRDSQGSLPKTEVSPYLDDKATEL
jgi:hypothetical protein